MTLRDQTAPFAPVILKLLQGVLYQEDARHWDLLLHHQTAVRDYLTQIGLVLYLDEAEGYAFIRQGEPADSGESLPRLIPRRPLSRAVTLFAVLLRESLQQFESGGSDSTRLVLTTDDVYDMLRPFFQAQSDEARLHQRFDRLINQMLDLGFLKRLQGQEENRYEVQRILKAKISADVLADIKGKLEIYAESRLQSDAR